MQPSLDAERIALPHTRKIRMNPVTVGYIAIGITVLIWASFAVSVRATGNAALSPADVSLMRFGVPALVLIPFLPSRISAIRQLRFMDAVMIMTGAGLPFFLLAIAGGARTSATHVGALIPGTTPLAVALLLWLFARHRPKARLLRAICVILAGVGVLIAGQGVPNRAGAEGVGLLLAASLLWAIYTLGLRRSGLDAVGCALILTLPSSALLVLLMATGVLTSNFGTFSLREALPFIAFQGIGAGVVASLTYTVAIARLGPARCAAIGSLAPALAALIAVPVLGETLTLPIVIAVLTISVGVALASRS